MDDFILIHESRDRLEQCYREIEKYLKNRFMEFNPKKTYIKPITDKIEYLGYIYRLTDTGKVVVLADPKKIKKAKQKIRRLKKLVEEGKRTKHDADIYFKCWKASIRFGNSHRLIENLNKWYIELWKERTWTTEK